MAKVKLVPEQIDAIVQKELRAHLKFCYKMKGWNHPEDIEYNIKLKEALKVVLEYFGGDPDEFE